MNNSQDVNMNMLDKQNNDLAAILMAAGKGQE